MHSLSNKFPVEVKDVELFNNLVEYVKMILDGDMEWGDSIYFPNHILGFVNVTPEMISKFFKKEKYGITFYSSEDGMRKYL